MSTNLSIHDLPTLALSEGYSTCSMFHPHGGLIRNHHAELGEGKASDRCACLHFLGFERRSINEIADASTALGPSSRLAFFFLTNAKGYRFRIGSLSIMLGHHFAIVSTSLPSGLVCGEHGMDNVRKTGDECLTCVPSADRITALLNLGTWTAT